MVLTCSVNDAQIKSIMRPAPMSISGLSWPSKRAPRPPQSTTAVMSLASIILYSMPVGVHVESGILQKSYKRDVVFLRQFNGEA